MDTSGPHQHSRVASLPHAPFFSQHDTRPANDPLLTDSHGGWVSAGWGWILGLDLGAKLTVAYVLDCKNSEKQWIGNLIWIERRRSPSSTPGSDIFSSSSASYFGWVELSWWLFLLLLTQTSADQKNKNKAQLSWCPASPHLLIFLSIQIASSQEEKQSQICSQVIRRRKNN